LMETAKIPIRWVAQRDKMVPLHQIRELRRFLLYLEGTHNQLKRANELSAMAAEMFGQEFFDPSVEVEIVLRPRETVALVGINDIDDFALCLAQCVHHPVCVRDRHPRIVLSLTDEQRRTNRINVIERRNGAIPLLVVIGITRTATATSLTGSAETMASHASNDCKGMVLVDLAAGGAYGYITGNTSGTSPVYTVDRWYVLQTPGGAAATTPGATDKYAVMNAGACIPWCPPVCRSGE